MLSTSTGYAILALSCMQEHESGDWVMVKEICQRTGVSKPYLHKLIHQLTKSGLVISKRGYKGGVALSKQPKYITLLEIVEQIEGHKWTKKCLLGLEACSDDRSCPAHAFWSKERQKIFSALTNITLNDFQKFEATDGKRVISLENINKILDKDHS